MKSEDVKVSMKVTPFSKSAGEIGLNNSIVWNYAKKTYKNFLYVVSVNKHNIYTLDTEMNDTKDGDYFNAYDFDIYYENNTSTISTYFEKETNLKWLDDTNKPTIDYVRWLENKIQSPRF